MANSSSKINHLIKKIAYQDIWVKGDRARVGKRNCKLRYDILQPFCKLFNRPITVLDIGANMGYFSFRLAEEFEGTYTMVEGCPYTQCLLYALCQRNDNPHVAFIPKMLTMLDILTMSKTQRFDLVIAYSVIHHFKEPYQKVLEALTQLGSYIMLEIPDVDENLFNGERVRNEPIDLKHYNHEFITSTPYIVSPDPHARNYTRDIYVIESPNRTIELPNSPNLYFTDIDLNARNYFCPQTNTFFKAPSGLRLDHFFDYEGLYPNKDHLIKLLTACDLTNATGCDLKDLYLSQGHITHYPSPHTTLGNAEQDRALLLSLLQQGNLNSKSWALHQKR